MGWLLSLKALDQFKYGAIIALSLSISFYFSSLTSTISEKPLYIRILIICLATTVLVAIIHFLEKTRPIGLARVSSSSSLVACREPNYSGRLRRALEGHPDTADKGSAYKVVDSSRCSRDDWEEKSRSWCMMETTWSLPAWPSDH